MTVDEQSGALVPLNPAADANTLPAPAALHALLAKVIEDGITRMRTERGTVHQPEDCYPLIRELARADDILADYAQAITAARTRIAGAHEEELAEAVGEKDGIPAGEVTVPMAGGDVKLRPDWSNVYPIDGEQVVAVVTAAVADEWGEQAAHDPAGFARAVVAAVLDPDTGVMGKTAPRVTKVRALAAQLSRRELDSLASVAKGAIGKPVRDYRGVKVERIPPKSA